MPAAELTIRLPDVLEKDAVELIAHHLDSVVKLLHEGKRFTIIEIPDDLSEEHHFQFMEGLAAFRDEWFSR